MGQLLWSWVLWGLWVLPGECRGRLRHRGSRTHHGAKEARGSVLQWPAWWGGEMGIQWITVGSRGLIAQPALAHTRAPPGNAGAAGMGPLVPAQDPAELAGSSRVSDSISAEQRLDMSPTVPELGMCQLSPGRAEQPSALRDGSGRVVPQVVLAALDPTGPGNEQEVPSSAAVSGEVAGWDSPQAGLAYPKQTDWPTSVPMAPGATQISSPVPSGHTMAVTHGNRDVEPATATLSSALHVPTEKRTGTLVLLGSSTTPTKSVGEHSALQSTTGQPTLGTAIPLQEGTVANERMEATSMLTGDVPAPTGGLSPSVTHVPASPLELGTEAPSSVTSTANDDDGLGQPHGAVTAEGTPGTAQGTVLSDVQHSTGTPPHSLTWIPAELHTAAVRLSQEVMPGLAEATSPLVTAASVTAGDTEPASTMSDRVTSPTVPATTGSPHHDGIQKSDTMILPGSVSATITLSPATDGVSEATAPGLPAPGTAGDGLHREITVTHQHVTHLLPVATVSALGTPATAMDVTTAPHVPTAPFPALGSAEMVSITAEATSATAVLQTEGTPMGLSMGTVPSAVPATSLPDGLPGGGYRTRTQAVTVTPTTHLDGSTSGWAGTTVTPRFGSDSYGPATGTLSASPHVPLEKETSAPMPLGSSTTPIESVRSPRALQSTTGQPMLGAAVPLQEGIVNKEHMDATSMLTGDVPAPTGGLSPPVTLIPAAPLVLGTEAPSSATSTANDDDGLGQPHSVVTAEGTPGTAQATVLSDVQHGTGTPPHSLAWIPAELHTAGVHLSQEVMPGLAEATSPLVTAASVTAGHTEPASTMSDRVTSPTVPATTGSPHHDGIQKSDTMILPGTVSATITPSPATDGVSEGTAPGLPAPGTAGDGLHREITVTHPHVTNLLHVATVSALGTPATAMDVTTAPHVSTAPFPALGSAEMVSITAEATAGYDVLQTEGTPMELGTGTVSSMVTAVSLPNDVPGGGYRTRTQVLTGVSAAQPSGSTFGQAAGPVTSRFGSNPYGPGTATLSPVSHSPTEKGMGTSVPSGSSTTPMKSVGSPRALQSTAGQPMLGTAVPLQEITVTEEHVSAISMLTGGIPTPTRGLSPAVIDVSAAPLVLGTEAPSSATSTANDDDGLGQPHSVVTAEGTPGTAQATVLSDVQHSTGTPPHSLTWIPAELHTAAVRLSQEVMPGLAEATSPLVTAASVTAGDTEPASTMSDRDTSPTVPATTVSPHPDGIQKSDTTILPGSVSATITLSPTTDGVSEGTAPGLPAPGTAGDGLHREITVTHQHVTHLLPVATVSALGTPATAMDVTTAPYVSTAPFPALGSAEMVSITAEATSATAVLQTEGTPMGLSMGTVPSAVPATSLPDGLPGGGYRTRTQAVTVTPSTHLDGSTSGWAGRTVTPRFGSDSYGPATGTLSASPHVPLEKETSAPMPLGSSTTPIESVRSPRALQSTTGQPMLGAAVPLQEGIVNKEHMDATSMLTGDVPAPTGGLSPPVTLIPAAPLVLGTEAPSSATSTANDDNGLGQPHSAVTAEGTPGTAQGTVLSDVQHSTGTPPHSLTWIPAELHTAAVRLSQEVMPGLAEATSPLVTAASVTAGHTEPASTMSDHDTSPTVPATTGSPHHDGVQKSDTMILPGSVSATITPSPATDGVSEATAPGLPAPGTAGDGLHREITVTHPHVTHLLHVATVSALGTPATAMDVTTAPHVSTAPFPALGSAETVSITAEATSGYDVLQNEGTPMELGTGTVSSMVTAVSLPDGVPGGGYSTRTQVSTGVSAAQPSGSTFGWAAERVTSRFGSNPYGPGTATLSPVSHSPTEKGMGTSVPSGSSTTPMKSVGSPRALQSTAGQPTLGTAVPLQEITVTEEHVSAISMLTGGIPTPTGSLSPAVIDVSAAPLVLGTEAPSSATSTANDDNGLGQPHSAVTAEGTPGTAQGTVLSDVQHSTGTSPHSLTWIPAELHTAAVRLSQEVMPGLAEATSPLVTAASVTAGDTEPASTMSDRVTSPTVPATTGSPHHDGIQKSDTTILPGSVSATITPSPATDGVSEATAPGLPAPGTAGDGLHRDTAVTHSRVTSQLHVTTAPALGTSTTAVDVTTASHVPTTPFPALGSAETVSITAEATSGYDVLQTEGTPMELGMGTVPSVVPSVSLRDGSTAGQMMGSAALGLGSSTQASTGSIPSENPTVGVPAATANTESTSMVSALPAPHPSSASTTAHLGTATPNHSHSTAQVTVNTDSSSATNPVAGGAEPGVRRVTPLSPSALDSQRPPISLASVTALSPALSRSAAEQDVSVSPSVFQNSSLAVVASSVTPTVVASITPSASVTAPAMVSPSITPSVSATNPALGTRDASQSMVTTPSFAAPSISLGPHSPHVTRGTPINATSSPSAPTLRDSSTRAWEATALSWKDTVPSSNAITPSGSPSIDTPTVTRHTTVSPPTAKATSSAQSPSAMHNVPTALRVTNRKATSAFAAMSSPSKGTPAASSPTSTAPGLGAQSGPVTAPGTPTYATSRNAVFKPGTELVPAVSLYPFGAAEGDTECVQRTVDFNSPLLRPEIGFPLGKALRDTLYFTDNGQIIFPPTDSHMPSSPHPPSQGFSSHEALPMVAAFWDDADFSRGVGTTWYQEYPTLGSIQYPIIRDVEAKIQKYLQVPYSAKWTLKVTWEKAPAFPSQLDDAQTNTYQAVLSTDGSRSFALLLYQDGGMRWDYARLAARDALIGFSSGDGYAQNSELTKEPPAVRYRPDQQRSSGMDVRGLWLFRLDRHSRVNYRLQCLTWLQAQPPPSTWSMELPPCPCSQPQAELDPRYRRSRSAESPPAPEVAAVPQNTSDLFVTVLRTTSPSRMGAGVRCVYRGTGLLEGWLERFWSPPTDPLDNGELEAFEWCCRQVGKPHFCTRYSEKRPRAGCEEYVPPTPANAFGDPHVTTLDGLTYTFNALGDFVLLLASDAHTSFVLQGRMARTGTAQATNFMAFVAQYTSSTTTTVSRATLCTHSGKPLGLEEDRVQQCVLSRRWGGTSRGDILSSYPFAVIHLQVEWTLGSRNEIHVLLNYETIQFSYSQDMGAEVYYSPSVLLVNTSSITAVFNGTISISVSASSGMLSAVCSLLEQYRNGTRGLLGVWNDNPADDFQMPNGTNIPVNSSEEDVFCYGMTWAVGEHSLFAQPLAAPVRTFNPIFLSQLRQENESQYQLAASQCGGCRECIYDMLSTGDVALGLATQSLVEDFQKRKAALNAFPPIITGSPLLTAFRTEQVTRQYRATGPGVRFVPHVSPELNVSEDGMLTWEPRGTAPLSITLQAVSPHLPPALLQLSFTLCSCRSIQQCDYNSTTTIASSSLQLAACRCDDGYWGPFCQHEPDPCAQGCFPGVGCDPHTGCGPCPPGLTGDGRHCAGDISTSVRRRWRARGTSPAPTPWAAIPAPAPAMQRGRVWDVALPAGPVPALRASAAMGDTATCILPPVHPPASVPPAFTDRHCVVAGGDFQPQASAVLSLDLPQRSVLLWVRALQSVTAEEVNATVSAILGSLEVKAFWSNANITHIRTADGLTFAVVAEFTYNSSSFVIRFLNEELTAAITTAFNGRRARRDVGAYLLFARLHLDNITDLVKLSVPELQHYFSCTLSGYEGYQLDYVGTVGLICISPCKKGYCQHSGRCQHLPEGPTCSCVPFSIFSPGGARCEQLAVSLTAFISIMVGALALLCLLFSIACLAAQLCRRHREAQGTKGTFWRQRPFSSLMKAEEGAETSGRLWEPQLRAIDPSIQMQIKRPHVLPPSQGAAQP
ncbi:mucin-4 isoform X1 [Gallus gallus]|uniref:mucin-4 isoform X1 n=1 Tax=Gallus gallus TaxID=9031 RepID=UPI001F00665E|nr:mucin-4 isoform X1 [Gallus gallus]